MVRNEYERGKNDPESVLLEEVMEAAYVALPYHHPTIGWKSDIEHVPIATVVRLPNADPAPIGRVLDAGADAVVIAMIESAEQAAAAVAATRYPPAGVRSFGPLRAISHSAILSRTPAFWARPAMPLGSHPPQWPARD